MSHRQVRELVCELEPKADIPARIRKLPDRSGRPLAPGSPQLGAPRVGAATDEPPPTEAASPGSESVPVPAFDLRPDPARPSSAPRASVEPLAPARFKVQFTAGAELRDKLERLQALMRPSVPDGDLAKIIDVAVTKQLERLEARRFAKTKKPRKRLAQTDTRPKSRYIPAAVRRLVEKRDEGRCTYRDKRGRRCTKRQDLEFHHRKPFGQGGHHAPENLALLCRTHNALLAEQDLGEEVMARSRRRASQDGGAGHVEVARAGPVDAGAAGTGPCQSGLRAQWRSSG